MTKSVLLAESSPTRRRIMEALLRQRGYTVLAPENLRTSYQALEQTSVRAQRLDAVLLGWPEFLDRDGENLCALLHAEQFEHIPVLLLADSASEALVKWRMTRPRTALLMWSEYADVPNALERSVLPAASAASGPREAPRNETPMRVLLVDDSPTVRAAFARLMQRQGYHVEIAGSASEGLQKAMSSPVDIAIVDYFMPGENGTSLIAALRRHPQTRHVLTAIITGTYSDEVIVESLASGAVECLFKSEARELFLARLASLSRTVQDRKAIDAERRRLEGILAAVGDGVFGVDTEGTIEFVNPAALAILGHTEADALTGTKAATSIHPAQPGGNGTDSFLSASYRDGESLPQWQAVFWSASRLPVPVEGTVYPLRVDGKRRGSVVAFRDVSAQRKMEEKLRWQAERDSLTELHNRRWFEQQLDSELTRLKHSDDAAALLFVDLDRFKYINDTAGHGAGDQLLIEVSRRIRSQLRPGDQLARLGGDEYAVILRNVPRDQIEPLGERIRRAVAAAPFSHHGKSYRITLSIGAVSLDRFTASSEEAMAHADIACHQSKSAGRNRTHVYAPESGNQAEMSADLGWSSRLQDALAHDRFELVFQPIVPLKGIENETGEGNPSQLWQRQFARNPDEPMLFEVLLRLRGEQGDLISPGAFLPTAERFGLMGDIDYWVIDHAIRALKEVRGHHRPIALTINLSAQALARTDLVDFVTDCLVRDNVDPVSLIFEVTESGTIEDIVGVRAMLKRLRLLGCRIAIDDFGTGFSTFAYLRQLDSDFLKIDGTIVQGLPDDALDRTVIASLASIAEITGKRTVAEWVENLEVMRVLQECGVDYAQGFGVGHPRLQLLPRMPNSISDDAKEPTANVAPLPVSNVVAMPLEPVVALKPAAGAPR